jgi:hypothetical protein
MAFTPLASLPADLALNGKLPLVTVCALARAGIKTPEQLREAYRSKVLKIRTIETGRLREIARVFFAGKTLGK